jgi:hypothetical protein
VISAVINGTEIGNIKKKSSTNIIEMIAIVKNRFENKNDNVGPLPSCKQ